MSAYATLCSDSLSCILRRATLCASQVRRSIFVCFLCTQGQEAAAGLDWAAGLGWSCRTSRAGGARRLHSLHRPNRSRKVCGCLFCHCTVQHGICLITQSSCFPNISRRYRLSLGNREVNSLTSGHIRSHQHILMCKQAILEVSSGGRGPAHSTPWWEVPEQRDRNNIIISLEV